MEELVRNTNRGKPAYKVAYTESQSRTSWLIFIEQKCATLCALFGRLVRYPNYSPASSFAYSGLSRENT